jgi:LysR family transcriptional regulator, nitrogen assimilation regulatory protein
MNAVDCPTHGVALQPSEAREKALGLRDLRSFLMVAHTGNLRRAASELSVSQPAISLQLRKLEEGFGSQLLLRHGRGVTLTPAGVRLRDRLQTIMELLASPLDEAVPQPTSQPTSRKLSIGMPGDAGTPLVAPLARAFRSRWPEVTLDVREGSGADLEEWLLHRHVDVAILQDPPSLPEIEMTPVLTESLGLVAPVHSRIAESTGALSLWELAQDLLILPGAGHWIRRRLDQAAQQHGVRMNPVLQVDSTALTKVMVRNEVGCTILPLSSVQDEIARGALAFRPIGKPQLTCTRVIAFHRVTSNTLTASFAAMACDAMATLAAGGAWPHAQVIRPAAEGITAQRPSV